MKLKIISLLLIVCMCFSVTFTGQLVSAAVMSGDLDQNGVVDIKDLFLLKKHLSNVATIDETYADCDGNGDVNQNDALELIRYLIKETEYLSFVYDEGWNNLYNWEDATDGEKPSGVNPSSGKATFATKSLKYYSVKNDINPISEKALGLVSNGIYYKNKQNGTNPTVGTLPSTIKLDTEKMANASNLRVLLNFKPFRDEIAVIYVGISIGLTRYYYRLTLESYEDFNYFYFADKEYTKFTPNQVLTYLDDEKLETKVITKDDLKNARYINFWLESDKGTSGAPLIIDDVDYFEGADGYDSTADDNALKQPEAPENDGATKYLAITFDDGPNSYSPTSTHYMTYYMDVAKKYGGKLSFFLIGNNCEKEDVDVLKRAVEEGHAIENHTVDHTDLVNLANKQTDYTKINEVIAQKVTALDDWLLENVGVKTSYIRPPYLSYNGNVANGIRLAGMKAAIGGKCPEDYNEPSLDYKELYYKKVLGDGSIALFHEHYITNVKLVDMLMDYYSNLGYEFVTVDKLFEIKGVTPNYNACYNQVK